MNVHWNQLLVIFVVLPVVGLLSESRAFARQVPTTKEFCLVEVKYANGTSFQCLISGKYELHPDAIEGKGPAAGPSPPIVELQSGWLYATGIKPFVGTKFISAAAQSTNVVVHIDGHLHKVYYWEGNGNFPVKIYDELGNWKFDLGLGKTTAANTDLVGTPISDPVFFDTAAPPFPADLLERRHVTDPTVAVVDLRNRVIALEAAAGNKPAQPRK